MTDRAMHHGARIGLLLTLTLAAPCALSADVRTYRGDAYDVRTGELLYSENFAEHYEDGKHASTTIHYRDPQGNEIARQLAVYRNGPLAPDYRLTDLRTGYTEAAIAEGDAYSLSTCRDGSQGRKCKTWRVPAPAVIDGGFTHFVQDHWDELAREGRALTCNYVAVGRLRYVVLEVRKVGEPTINGVACVRFRLAVAGAVASLFVQPAYTAYDAESQRLMEYCGISNLTGPRGRRRGVRIIYTYPGMADPPEGGATADPTQAPPWGVSWLPARWPIGQLVVAAWLAMALLHVGLTIVQRARPGAPMAAVGWASGLALLAAWYALMGNGHPTRRVAMAVLAGLWALRPAAQRLVNRVPGAEPQRHGQSASQPSSKRAALRLFGLFQVQAIWATAVAVPFLVVACNRTGVPTGWDAAALVVWLIGVGGQSIADAQSARWRRRPEDRGEPCRSGLWRWLRRPDAWFAWVHWWTYVPMAVGSPWIWWAFVGPLAMLLPVVAVLACRGRGIWVPGVAPTPAGGRAP